MNLEKGVDVVCTSENKFQQLFEFIISCVLRKYCCIPFILLVVEKFTKCVKRKRLDLVSG